MQKDAAMDRDLGAATQSDRAAPAVPPAISKYLAEDYSLSGPLAKALLERVDGEAAIEQIGLSDLLGLTPADLTGEMESWYRAYVAPPRGEALRGVVQLFAKQSEKGKTDAFALPLRLGTLDEDLLDKKLRLYDHQSDLNHNRAEEILKLEAKLLDEQQAYDTKKAEYGGREARILNWWLYLIVLFVVVFGSEAAINLDSFEALPWATQAIAWGATILIGLALGFAAHYHGMVYRQWGWYFDPAERDTKRGPALQMFAGGTALLFAALAFVYYARSAYFLAFTSATGPLDSQDSGGGGSFLWVVGGSLLGNIIVYLVGTFWAYLLHDPDPEYPETKKRIKALEKRIGFLTTSMEQVRARALEQMQAAHDRAVETAKRVSASLATQSRYRQARDVLAEVQKQDDSVLAVLLSYRTRLIQRASALGKNTQYMSCTDDVHIRSKSLSAGEYGRRQLKCKYLEQ
jgi:hypothetical protein